jgi:hypothetical protein
MGDCAGILAWLSNATTFFSVLLISKKGPGVGLKVISLGYALFLLYGIASQQWAFVVFNSLYLAFSAFKDSHP